LVIDNAPEDEQDDAPEYSYMSSALDGDGGPDDAPDNLDSERF
jgi:hypothetical protein